MNERLKSVFNQGSNFGGWVKGFVAIGAIVMACSVAYYKVYELERYSGAHYRNIQELQNTSIQTKIRVDVLETRADKSDQKIEKFVDAIHQLNLNIVELNTTLKAKQLK